MENQIQVKEDLKTVALGTSKINYLDPRITVAWCKRNEVPIEKVNTHDQALISTIKLSWINKVSDWLFLQCRCSTGPSWQSLRGPWMSNRISLSKVFSILVEYRTTTLTQYCPGKRGRKGKRKEMVDCHLTICLFIHIIPMDTDVVFKEACLMYSWGELPHISLKFQSTKFVDFFFPE